MRQAVPVPQFEDFLSNRDVTVRRITSPPLPW